MLWDAAGKNPTIEFQNFAHAFGRKIGLIYLHDQKSEKAVMIGSADVNDYNAVTGK